MKLRINGFLSLKNACLLSVLVAIYAAARFFNAYSYNEYIDIVIGVVAFVSARKYVSNIAVKWTLYAVSLCAIINDIFQIAHLYYHDPRGYVCFLFFAIICVLGIRKTNVGVEKADILIFMLITLLPWILNCVLRPLMDFSPTISTSIYSSVLLFPFVIYTLLFVISLRNTSDEGLKKSIVLSSLGCIGLLILFLTAIIIGLGYNDEADIWIYHFEGYDWLDTGVTIIATFFAGCMMSAYFIHLLIKSKYTMKAICIPAIIGMICVGILAAFTVGNTYRPESIMYGLERMLIGFIIASFGTYKLYKKL